MVGLLLMTILSCQSQNQKPKSPPDLKLRVIGKAKTFESGRTTFRVALSDGSDLEVGYGGYMLVNIGDTIVCSDYQDDSFREGYTSFRKL